MLVFFSSCNEPKSADIPTVVGNEYFGRVIDTTSPITMDKFIGLNAFVDDPSQLINAAGFVREYHNWFWDEGDGNPGYKGFPQSQIRFAPSFPGWSYDDFYRNLNDIKVEVAPCIQGSVPWLQKNSSFQSAYKPLDAPGLSAANPQSYHAKANFMYQFAARYGQNVVNDSFLQLDPHQKRVSGLGYVKYIEDWNEQDRTWEGKNAEFTSEEYAAMASADYDGHGNTMNLHNKKYGIKNADSSAKLVMGGLAIFNIDYIKRMKSWFERNRPDKIFAADVLNFHLYTFPDGSQFGDSGPALSPEAGKLKEQLIPVIKYRNDHLPGKEVWVSEFGWDTHPDSRLSVPEIGSMDRQEVQGIWLVRAYMALAAAGVDRAQMYMLRDVNPDDKMQFASCGLVGPKGSWAPKKSWYYVATLKNMLTNMRFAGEVASADPNVLVYKFKDVKSSKGVYAVWAQTSNDYRVENFSIQLSGQSSSAEMVSLLTGSTSGERQLLTINGGKVAVAVSERPVFILVDHIN
ncbi:hypothetical protein [Niabella hibiscisoli]|uniref:hypothetical protein n=1 Tax=Niabella hibiscisoli TaxID=1825928 RepID=UPI001F0D2D72|nr:hypothetical protein [Niabella hibiscisoli]MCH5720418.1 hypothetical protein [Niabella hibiscisoli]